MMIYSLLNIEMNSSLTIIIPAYNESKRIKKSLDDIDFFILQQSNKSIYVIVVNDGSKDNTKETVNDWIENKSKNKKSFKLIGYENNKGKGYAVKEGILNSTSSDLILYTDADGAAPIKEVEKLIYWIEKEGFDIAVGSRVLKDKDSKIEMSFKRRFVGRIFHTILKTLGLAPVYDTQCGFKLFKASEGKLLAKHQKCFGFSFDIEYLYLAKKLGYKVKEVPINWHHVEGSKVSVIRDSIKMFLEVIKIRFFNQYNI